MDDKDDDDNGNITSDSKKMNVKADLDRAKDAYDLALSQAKRIDGEVQRTDDEVQRIQKELNELVDEISAIKKLNSAEEEDEFFKKVNSWRKAGCEKINDYFQMLGTQRVGLNKELKKADAKLTETKEELVKAKEELKKAKEELKKADAKLTETKEGLEKARLDVSIIPSSSMKVNSSKLMLLKDVKWEDGNNVINFKEEILGSGVKNLYIRDCYRELWSECQCYVDKCRGIHISGTPGIGKSFFAIYSILNLIRNGEPVLYLDVKDTFHLFNHSKFKEIKYGEGPFQQRLKSELSKFPESPDPLEINEKYLVNLIQEVKQVWFVIDPSKDYPLSEVFPPCKTLIVASPGRERVERLQRKSGSLMKLLYMPVWERPELEPLREIGGFEKIFDTEFDEKFSMIGGVPRLLEFKMKEIEIAILKALEMYAKESYSQQVYDDKVKGVLLHIHLGKTNGKVDYTKKYITPATPILAMRILETFMLKQKENLITFLSLSTDEPLIAPFRGTMAQRIFSDAIMTLKLPIRRLFPPGVANGDIKDFTFSLKQPDHTLRMMHLFGNDLSNFTESKTGVLYIPYSKNFPSVDSFAFMKRKDIESDIQWSEGGDDLCLIGFQYTISGEATDQAVYHGFKYSGLQKLYTKCANVTSNPQLLFYLVTVVFKPQFGKCEFQRYLSDTSIRIPKKTSNSAVSSMTSLAVSTTEETDDEGQKICKTINVFGKTHKKGEEDKIKFLQNITQFVMSVDLNVMAKENTIESWKTWLRGYLKQKFDEEKLKEEELKEFLISYSFFESDDNDSSSYAIDYNQES